MWEPGARVLDDRFQIVTVLKGSGGAERYVAEQLSLKRQVALRVFPAAGARFDEDVRRLASVDHPAVVRVLESGHSGAVHFLVSELAQGPRLADELKGEPLMPDRSLELLTQVAQGLAAIHEKGLVHGELRPIHVLPQGRLVDFGLERLGEPDSPDARTTVMPQIVGPIEYLSPEQAGGGRSVAADDLYAFGALAFHVLSGVLPSGGKTLAQAAPHLADQAGLCALVMRCLEKSAVLRPASAAELAKLLAKLPPPAEPTIFLEAMQRPPPVPVAAPAPAPAPPPLPPAPAATPLLASVEMLVVPAGGTPSIVVATAPAPPASPWPMRAAATAVVIGLVIMTVVFFGGSEKREVRRLIERRQPIQALEIIGKAQRKLTTPSAELNALKVAALHLNGAHAEEAAALKAVATEPEALDPLVLGGVVEDFSRKEDPALRTILAALPPKGLSPLLEGFAQEPLSPRQWGALRYLDLAAAAAGLNLTSLYSASLESSDCGVRKTSAKRLGQLMDDASEAALSRLRDVPREGSEKSCGQDEALAALQALQKAR